MVEVENVMMGRAKQWREEREAFKRDEMVKKGL